jgi:pimeloyl-ACP methyl ester carboxylesterase
MLATKPMRYAQAGHSGPTVVYLHGLLGRPADFRDPMQILSERFRQIAFQMPIDAPHTGLPDPHSSIAELSVSVHELMCELDLDDVTLVGHSLGGQVAVDYCSRYPERVSRLVLTASAGLYEQNVSHGVRPHPCPDYIREIGRDVFYDPIHITDEHIQFTRELLTERSSIRFLLRLAKATRDRPVGSMLHQIDIPALIVWGRDDVITPPFVAEEFQRRLPRAQLTFIDECGHAPPVEHPRAFARALGEFIDAFATNRKNAA